MIDETLFKSDYLGKDGFIWWIGQVADSKSWKSQSLNANFQDSTKKDKNWPERCKVRIIGYHTFRATELSDEDLPWAHIMMDPIFGSAQGGEGATNNLAGGEVCFGFFLDGDDAQQPVVVGLLNRHRMVQNFPNDEDFAFRPFTGHSGNIPSTKRERLNDTLPGQAASPITSTIENANPGIAYTGGVYGFTPGLDLGVNSSPINIKFGDTVWNTNENLAHLAFDKKVTFTYSKPSGCRDNMIGQITQILQDFIGFTNGIQKYASTYIDPILNEVVDIGNSIKSTARSIVGIIRLIINSIRGALLKCIIKLFKNFIGVIVPPPQQTIAAQATKSILDQLFCLFEKLLPEILSFLENYLTKMVDTVFNAPICAVEQFTAGILTNVMDAIENSIDTIISGINWLTGGLSKVFNVLNQASSLANKIYSFIGCDSLKCKTPSQWVSTIGPSKVDSDNWSKMVGNINVIKGVSDGLGSVEGALADLSLYGQGSNYQNCNKSVNSPTTQYELSRNPPGVIRAVSIPPIIDVYGDGDGAVLVPVVGEDNSLISVEIVSGGSGYTYPPILTVVDKSGYGAGAEVNSVIDSNGTVIKTIIKKRGRRYKKSNYGINDNPNFDLLLTTSKYRVYEGESFTIKVISLNIADNTEISYKITGVTSSDIKQNIEGSLVIKNSSASIEIETNIDNIIEYKELKFNLPNYNKSISILIEDITAKGIGTGTGTDTGVGIGTGTGTGGTGTGTGGTDTGGGTGGTGGTGTGIGGTGTGIGGTGTGIGTGTGGTDTGGGTGIKIKTYILNSDNYNINEGSSFNIELLTTNIENNTLVPFKISGISDGLISNQSSYNDFNVVNNKSSLKFQTTKGVIKNNEIFVLELINEKVSVGVLINSTTSPGIVTDPKVCVQELIVIKPGIGYTLGDTATDGTNIYYPIISPDNGAIISIKPLNPPICGFQTIPDITINTTTGIGAEILPVVVLDTSLSSGGVSNESTIKIKSNIIEVIDCI